VRRGGGSSAAGGTGGRERGLLTPPPATVASASQWLLLYPVRAAWWASGGQAGAAGRSAAAAFIIPTNSCWWLPDAADRSARMTARERTANRAQIQKPSARATARPLLAEQAPARDPMLLLRTFSLLFPTTAAASSPSPPSPGTVDISVVGGFQVQLAVQGASAFRLSVCKSPCTPTQIPTVMLAPHPVHAQATTTASSIHTAFGSLALDSASGVLTLTDSAGKTLSKAALGLSQTAKDGGVGAGAMTTSLSLGKSGGGQLYGAGAGHNVGFTRASILRQQN
jgi:hypothetical protein